MQTHTTTVAIDTTAASCDLVWQLLLLLLLVLLSCLVPRLVLSLYVLEVLYAVLNMPQLCVFSVLPRYGCQAFSCRRVYCPVRERTVGPAGQSAGCYRSPVQTLSASSVSGSFFSLFVLCVFCLSYFAVRWRLFFLASVHYCV